ncbi:hypothetical protein BZA70DRAFT_196145 [Myxozyma melibiosi]|uniref:Uncharacterized protein n=1 Tax=Myxozyma melibiosi TaxID=54550 RepID=A0ABR1F3Y7_9ASCO
MLASAAAADDTAHSSSDDDSYALPVLSSYALALLSADGNNNNNNNNSNNSNSNDIGASSGDSRSRRTSYDPEQQLHQSKYLQSTSALINAARERRKSREASNSPYTAAAGSAPRTRFREDLEEINSNSNADQPTRKLSGSPGSFVAATPHHRAGADSTEFRSSENGGAGSGSREGLVTPAFTRPTLGSHGEPPTSQYRSIFRKSKPGRLGPPKRALRRESQEGENDGVPIAKSPSASPKSKENSKDDEHELRRTIDEAGGNGAGRLRFSTQDEEIPRGDTYWSSRSSREYTSASSKESEQHRTSISSGEISRLEIRDQAHSRTTSPRTSGSPRKALSPKTMNDDLHGELRQKPLHRSSPFNYGIEERRHHTSSPYEAAKELTSLIHKSLTPKHPPPTTEALAPSPVIQSFVVADNGYVPESPVRLVSEKKPLYENINPTPFTESHREEKHHHHRQVFSPLNKDENPRQQRPLAADIYHDEPPRANQAHSNPRSSHSSRLVGRQLLTPLSSNIIRPVRTSTPPPECNIYDPPPKMSNLDIPRPTPKIASKKQKNTVVVSVRQLLSGED